MAQAPGFELKASPDHGQQDDMNEEKLEEGGEPEPRNKVLIVGAPGVGKSRVIQELLSQSSASDGGGEDAGRSQSQGFMAPGSPEHSFWSLPIRTKYYTATLDLWEIPVGPLSPSVLSQGNGSSHLSVEEFETLGLQASRLLEDAQALVLMFDTERPQSFAVLRAWGENLLRLQALGSAPEVCLCVANSVRRPADASEEWTKLLNEANEWCIDHGLELVGLAHGPEGARSQHPVECRTLLHDLHTSVEGSARIAEALQCNMWRSLDLVQRSSVFSGAPEDGDDEEGNGDHRLYGQSGLFAGLLAGHGSSDNWQDLSDEGDEGYGNADADANDWEDEGAGGAGGNSDWEDDWARGLEFEQQQADPGAKGEENSKKKKKKKKKMCVLGSPPTGAGRDGSVSSSFTELERESLQEQEYMLRKAKELLELHRKQNSDPSAGDTETGVVAEENDAEEEEEDPDMLAFFESRAAARQKEDYFGMVDTERASAVFDPQDYQELLSLNGSEPEAQRMQDFGEDEHGNEDEKWADEDSRTETAEQPSPITAADSAQTPAAEPSAVSSLGVPVEGPGESQKRKKKNKKNKKKTEKSDSFSMDQEQMESDSWEQMIERVQHIKRSAQHLPDAVRRQNAEDALLALLKVWDRMDLAEEEEEADTADP